MTDFETRVQEIMNSEDADHEKLEKIRKLYASKIDPTTCKNDRLYRVAVSDYETLGWRGNQLECHWAIQRPNGNMRWEEDRNVTVLGEYHPGDEHVGKVYERIEDAVADGMGQYTVLKDKDGDVRVFVNGGGIRNRWAPFTVLHWVPKEAG